MKYLPLTLVAIVIGCGVVFAQDDEQATESDSELIKVKSSFQETWVHPDADFTKFSKLYLWDALFEYRDVGPAQRTRTTMMSSRKREFGISDADREKFEEMVSEAFVKEIQKSKKLELVDEIGPGTLILRGAVLDIISLVPPDTIGRSEIYLSSMGEATLVVELIDAENGEVAAVVAERRAIARPGSSTIDSFSTPTTSVTVIAEVRRWSTRAASKLRKELDRAIAGD